MTLGNLIDILERKEPDKPVMFDFVHFRPKGIHSFRGYYYQLAIGYTTDEDMTVGKLLQMLKDADGKTFTGYKGGEYIMDRKTRVWVANRHESGTTGIINVRDDSWCVRLITGICD
jgi:hypothetical protein